MKLCGRVEGVAPSLRKGSPMFTNEVSGNSGLRGGREEDGLLKIKLVKAKRRRGRKEKWRKSSIVLLIDYPLPISQD